MMSAPELTPMVLSLALALLALTGTTDGAITCEAVTTMYESTVTCFFGTDIFDTKHSFNLQFYYPNLQADPETRLMCNWVSPQKMDCKESEGVVYNRVLAEQMTVKGPADPRRAGGKYVCQVLPSLGVPVKPCNLTFRDVTTTTTTTTTTTQPIALGDLTEKVNATLIVSCLVLVVALIILIVIVCTRFKLVERIIERTKKEPDREKTEETADAGENVNLPEQMPLIPVSKAEEVNEEKVQSGKEEAGLLPMKETPKPSSGEASPPVALQRVEIQPAGKEDDKVPELSAGEDDQPEVDNTEEANPQPVKKKKWWQFGKRSSSSAPKEQPGDEKSTGTGDRPEVILGDEDTSSGKQKKKLRKSKEVKGEGEMELPGTGESQQPPTVYGREEPRRRQRDK